MIRKKIFAMPYDASHKVMFEDTPVEYTSEIGMPGVFVKRVNTSVSLKTGEKGEMDSAYIADPDYKTLFRRVAVGLGHQSIPVSPTKLDQIGVYEIHLKSETNLPTLMAISTHTDKEKSKTRLVRSPSDIMELYFPDLGEEKIYEKLNMMREIINSRDVLTNREAINLGIIVLYAPRECACEITEEVVGLYSKISHNLDYTMQHTLYSVISMMIDAYFDDESEYRRLIDLMDVKTAQNIVSEFNSDIRFKAEFQVADAKIAERDDIIAEKDATIADMDAIIVDDKAIIAERDAIIAENKAIIAENKAIIADKDAIIAKLEAQIEKLNGK